MKLKTLLLASLTALTIAMPTWADDKDADDDDAMSFSLAGLLSSKNRGEIPELKLSAGEPLLASGEIKLKSGKYYELEIEADGSQELSLVGPEFFRAIWIDEIVIEGIEIRPFGLSSMEFDEEGTVELSFIAIKPGTYALQVPGNDLQKVMITIQ